MIVVALQNWWVGEDDANRLIRKDIIEDWMRQLEIFGLMDTLLSIAEWQEMREVCAQESIGYRSCRKIVKLDVFDVAGKMGT